jgi:penicillin-binding protein 1A
LFIDQLTCNNHLFIFSNVKISEMPMKRKRRLIRSLRRSIETDKKPPFFKRYPWLLYPIFALAGLGFISTILILYFSQDLPSLTELEQYDPYLVTRIYSANGHLLEELAMQNRVQISLEQLREAEGLIPAVLAIEDRRFYSHWGLDLKRIIKAMIIDLITFSKREGASTITQQLARMLHLSLEKSWSRKIREQLTSLQIERTYAKDEILEMYLNHYYFGHGAYGVQSAAQRYFQKNVEDLKIEESALLAGIINIPAAYSPFNHPEAAFRRRNIVLHSMVECGFLTEAEYDSLRLLELGATDHKSKDKRIAPYFVEHIRQIVYEKYGELIYTGGLSIYTTLDTRVQACADSAVRAFLPEMDKNMHERMLEKNVFAQYLNPPLETPEEIETLLADTAYVDSLFNSKFRIQAALVAIDPSNGHILAMVGGRDFEQSEWNRATQMKRQPGSSFKPFVYTVAIDNGYPATTELLDQPVVIIMEHDGSRWSPPNFDLSSGGPTTLREALRRSLNQVTVRLVQEIIPPKEVVSYAEKFGFTTKIKPVDAIALGSEVVIPLEIASAFSVFANRGVRMEPVAILRIEDREGNIMEEYMPRGREVISEEIAYIMTDLLQEVITHSRGTGHAAQWKYKFYRPAAGKTGTTNDYRNAWFVGFTNQIVAAVWVGMDDERITLGDNQTGAKTALPIWAPFMLMAHDTLHLPPVEFNQPATVIRLPICSKTKKIATDACPEVWEEVFTEEMVPTDTCDLHKAPYIRESRPKQLRGIY